jgi:hypothetical protein
MEKIKHKNTYQFILCKYKEKYYYGEYSFDKEFNSLDELNKFIDNIDYYQLKSNMKNILESGIPELIITNKIHMSNGWESLINLTTSSELLDELYKKSNNHRAYIIANKNCPIHILEEESKVLHPNKGKSPWLLQNESLPYNIVNMFNIKVLRYFHESYYNHFFEEFAAKYDWKNHEELKYLLEHGKVTRYNCPKCSGNNESDYNCNTENIRQLPSEECQTEKCPHCDTVMIFYKAKTEGY